MPKPSQATLRRLKRHDLLARWVVTLGGVVVIASVIGILVMILATTLPLFLPARARLLAETPLPPSVKAEGVLGLGIESAPDDRWQVAHLVDASGTFRSVDLATGNVIQELKAGAGPMYSWSAENSAGGGAPGGNPLVGAGRAEKGKATAPRTVLSVDSSGPASFTLRWSDGAVSLVDVVVLPRGKQAVGDMPQFELKTRAVIPPDGTPSGSGVPLAAVMRSTGEKSSACAALYEGNRIVVVRQNVIKNEMTDEETTSASRLTIQDDVPGRVTALTMDHAGGTLYAGTENGLLLWWRLGEDKVINHDVVPPFFEKRAITCLQLMLGDVTLVVGDAAGSVTNWFFVVPESERNKTDGASAPATAVAKARGNASPQASPAKKEIKKLTLVRSLESHAAGIQSIVPSPRNRALLVRDASGVATMDFTTSERRLKTFHGVDQLAFSSRGDIVLALAGGSLKAWRIEGSFFGLGSTTLHPEVSWLSLCGRVWYEGHDAPDFSWQSTGGTDDYEPKLSLAPLVFGTLKGTFYAMLLAGPLALGAAIYVSQFSSPALRAWIKPAIEIMACVPSVVLGFLVGMWLAPIIKDGLVALFLSAVSIPLVFLAFLFVWQQARKSPAAQRQVRSREFLLGGMLLAVGVAVAACLSTPVEQRLFGGNLVMWLSTHLGVVYDQRNSILIAFGVGFMVIPIIFTLAEDALSSVPHSMTAASMALGATRWQTLWRIVLPSASPGIFAAVMIGFGRAVGETMVFLMAVGNSAQMDWSPFNGMRTLSANIAQEFPEAPVDGTLYRVLFLCAVVLFMMTFVLNTAAEIVRQRLRKRFGQF
jgi:phosphate transport system permease protein